MQILEDKSIQVHVLMRRFSKEELLAELKCDDMDIDSKAKTADFLISLFYQKDKNLENFYSNSVSDGVKRDYRELFDLRFKNIIFGFSAFSLSSLYLLRTDRGRKLFCEIYMFGTLMSLLRF